MDRPFRDVLLSDLPWDEVMRLLMPEVEMHGEGTVIPPAVPHRASYDRHYQEFLSRGLAPDECDRLAREVVARDDPPPEKE